MTSMVLFSYRQFGCGCDLWERSKVCQIAMYVGKSNPLEQVRFVCTIKYHKLGSFSDISLGLRVKKKLHRYADKIIF
jgi:hypothetical protein